jgi:hypothetical protein
MTPAERLLQRTLDGMADPARSAAAEHLDPAHLEALRRLDAALKVRAEPRQRVAPEVVVARIVAALPATAPAAQVRVRPVDILVAVLAATVLAMVYGMVATVSQTILAQTMWLAWAVGLSLGLGLVLLVLPGVLRSWESGLFHRLLGRPIAIGPADALIYRAVGAGLVIGGIWLGI